MRLTPPSCLPSLVMAVGSVRYSTRPSTRALLSDPDATCVVTIHYGRARPSGWTAGGQTRYKVVAVSSRHSTSKLSPLEIGLWAPGPSRVRIGGLTVPSTLTWSRFGAPRRSRWAGSSIEVRDMRRAGAAAFVDDGDLEANRIANGPP